VRLSIASTRPTDMSIRQDSIDIYLADVDGIDRFVQYVDFQRFFRQVQSIGRLHRQIRDPGTEIADCGADWVLVFEGRGIAPQDGISNSDLSLHPRYRFAIESAAGSDND